MPHPSDFVKGQISALFADHVPMREIARRVGVSEASVRRNLKKEKQFGSMDRRHVSKPRVTTAHEDRRLKRVAATSSFKTADEIKMQVLGPASTVSVQTIRNRIHEGGMSGCSPAVKPLLSRKNIKARLRFARSHKHWTQQQWANVLWSDESKFNLFRSDGKMYVWRREGERYDLDKVRPTVKHGGGSVMVWGCFSLKGMGNLCLIEGIMDAEMYREILKSTMIPSAQRLFPRRKFIFQQDNDPKHTSKLLKAWFANPVYNDKGSKRNFTVLTWPSQSPDLNPIENLWAQLEYARLKMPEKPSNKTELMTILQEAWSKLDLTRSRKLIESMPLRCREVIKAKGHHTHY